MGRRSSTYPANQLRYEGVPGRFRFGIRHERFASGETHDADPVSVSDAVNALKALCQRPGTPRWAVTAWAAALAGPLRDLPRVEERTAAAQDSPAALDTLLDELAPAPVAVRWPDWMQGREDPVLLGLGVAAGKPDRTSAVDIPVHAKGLVVDIGRDGLCRFICPQWRGDILSSVGHLAGLAELVRHAGITAETTGAAEVLVRWAVGWNRADIGAGARAAALPEVRTAAAAEAARRLTAAAVSDVLAQVLDAAGEAQ